MVSTASILLIVSLDMSNLLFLHLPLHYWYFPLLSLAYCFHHVLVSPYIISLILMLVTPLLVEKKKKSPSLI